MAQRSTSWIDLLYQFMNIEIVSEMLTDRQP